MRLFNILLLLSTVCLSFAAPVSNFTFLDEFGCERDRIDYIILVEIGVSSSPFDAIRHTFRSIGVGLLRQPNTRVGFCTYNSGGSFCDDFVFDTMETSFLSKAVQISRSGSGGGANYAISEAMGLYSSDQNKKRMVIIQYTQTSSGETEAARARDAGIEIFTIGNMDTSFASRPFSIHHFPLIVYDNNYSDYDYFATETLNLVYSLRNQVGDACYAWGFGQTHVLTFDGVQYDFAGVGDYYLFKTDSHGEDNLQVQVRQLTRPGNEDLRSGVTQIRAVAVDALTDQYIIKYDPDLKLISFYYFGSEIFLKGDFDDAEDYDFISPHSVFYGDDTQLVVRKFYPENAYVIDIESYLDDDIISMRVSILLSDTVSGIIINPPATAYGASSGLCGYYDGCPNNDFLVRDRNLLDVSTERRIRKYAPEFIENWRIRKITESQFDLTGFEEYLPTSKWKPFTSTRGHRNADKVCAGLPAYLEETCRFDVGARQHVFASFASRLLINLVCQDYCTNDREKRFHAVFEVETVCRAQCLSTERSVNLHTKYNSTYVPPPVIFRGGESSSLFKPVANIGGNYVFQLKSNDRCLAIERNITFRVTCDEPPVVTAYAYFDLEEEEVEEKTFGVLTDVGVSHIMLHGSVSNINSDYRLSWLVINATLPFGQTELSYDLESRLIDANENLLYSHSLNPLFIPPWIGQFDIELAVNDGCQVTRSVVIVQVNCSSCEVLSRVETFQKNSWIKDNGYGYWPDKFLNVDIYEKTSTSLYGGALFYEWTLVSKDDGALIDREDEDEYLVYKLISPRTTLTTKNTVEPVAKSTPSVSFPDPPNPNGFPFTQDVYPYVVPELKVVVTQVTWTETFISTFEEVFIPEKRDELCYLYLDDFNDDSTDVEFSDYADLDEDLAKCPGYYTFQAMVADGCDLDGGRKINDTVILHLDCGLPPRVFLSCNAYSEFDYNTLSFDTVSFDGSATYDPRPNTDTDGDHLIYTWEIVSHPPGSTASISSPDSKTNSFTPSIKGTYTISLTASNQCNKEIATVNVQAVCVDPPTVILQVDDLTLDFDGSEGSPEFVFNSTVTHEFPSSISYFWELVSAPVPPVELLDIVSSPYFSNQFAEDPTFHATYGGKYVINLGVSDSCQLPVNSTIELTYTCPGSVTITLSAVPTTVEFNYTTNSFPSVSLDGSASSAISNGAPYTPSPSGTWFVLSTPSESEPDFYDSSSLTTFFPDELGQHSFRFIFSDQCIYRHQDVSFQTTCPHTPVPVPVLYTEGPILVQNSTTFGDNSNDPSNDFITWELVYGPEGFNFFPQNTFNVTFTPTLPGKYIFQATIDDGCKTGSTNLTIQVGCQPVEYSTAPALVSPISNYAKGKFSRVEMFDLETGLGTYEPDNLNFRWIVISAPVGSIYQPYDTLNITEETTVDNDTIDGPDNSTFTITTERVVYYKRLIRYVELAPADYPTRAFASCFYPDLPGTYRVKLTISEFGIDDPCFSRNSTELSIEARCNNAPNVVVADQTVTLQPNKYTRVNLDASATTDVDGDSLTFRWEIDEFHPDNEKLETLSSSYSPIASFIVHSQGSYIVRLTVSDGCQNVTRVVTITADCPTDNEVDEKKKIEIVDILTSKFDGVDIAFQDFEYVDAAARELCTNEFSWELIDYNSTDITTTEPFTSTAGFIAVVVIVPIVGTALIAGIIFVALKKTGVIGSKG